MRDRLIELLKKTPLCNKDFDLQYSDGTIEKFADYLLENGVIVLPCKVGDVVYAQKGCFYLPHATQIKSNAIITCEVIAIKETKKGKYILLKPLLEESFGMRSANGWFPFSSLGKTVFLTREEAEQALKEGGKG